MSIATKVRELLKQRPYVLEALEEDIVNQSSLSKRVASELKVGSLLAVKAAVRRFAEELREHKKKREEDVLAVLKHSSITLHDGLKVVIAREPIDIDSKVAVGLDGVFVYLLDKSSGRVQSELLSTHEQCGTFVITSPPLIEETPGVVSYLTSLLTEQGINVIEFVSCYTKTLLVVDRKDVSRAYEILSSVIG
jgi:hypothetical protein